MPSRDEASTSNSALDADTAPLRTESEQLRHAMTRLSSGVAVVTAAWQGRAHALTATALCSVSLDPALILVCVGRASRFHPAILGSRSWAVSLLSAEQESVARHFAHRGRDLNTQFDAVAHRTGPRTGAPLLDGALAWLECETHAVHDGGDHSIVVGRVLDAAAAGADVEPLTYYRGTYS